MGVVICMTMGALVLAWLATRERTGIETEHDVRVPDGVAAASPADSAAAVDPGDAVPEGVPEPLIEGDDDVHKIDGPRVYSTRALGVRIASAQAVLVPDRLARGSVPPPFASMTAGEFVTRPLPGEPPTGPTAPAAEPPVTDERRPDHD